MTRVFYLYQRMQYKAFYFFSSIRPRSIYRRYGIFFYVANLLRVIIRPGEDDIHRRQHIYIYMHMHMLYIYILKLA